MRIVEPDNAFITRSVFDEETKIGKCEITTFESAGTPHKQTNGGAMDFTLRQTCHA